MEKSSLSGWIIDFSSIEDTSFYKHVKSQFNITKPVYFLHEHWINARMLAFIYYGVSEIPNKTVWRFVENILLGPLPIVTVKANPEGGILIQTASESSAL